MLVGAFGTLYMQIIKAAREGPAYLSYYSDSVTYKACQCWVEIAIRDNLVKSVNVADAETEGGVLPSDLTRVPHLDAKLSIHAFKLEITDSHPSRGQASINNK